MGSIRGCVVNVNKIQHVRVKLPDLYRGLKCVSFIYSVDKIDLEFNSLQKTKKCIKKKSIPEFFL